MGRGTRSRRSSAPFAAVALALLAALAACGGGDDATTSPPPSSTPTATTTPVPSPTSRPTPTATTTPVPSPTPRPTPTAAPSPAPEPTPAPTPTPVPCRGIECIEPAPNAFEHKTWAPGQTVDWERGAFILETQTGRIHGYRAKSRDAVPTTSWILPHGWIGADLYPRGASSRRYNVNLLLDRESLRAWRWPEIALHLVALSEDHVLFRERSGDRHTLMTREGKLRAQFSVPVLGPAVPNSGPTAIFSPDGQVLVIQGIGKVYRMPLTSPCPEVLFEPEARDGWTGPVVRVAYSSPSPASGQQMESVTRWNVVFGNAYHMFHPLNMRNQIPPGLVLVDVRYSRLASPDKSTGDEEVEYDRELHLFSWEGAALSEVVGPVCEGIRSPDGRYIAREQGERSPVGPKGYVSVAWPAVVIASAETCEPLFRVRSAYILAGYWHGQWLSNSEGFVVGVAGGNYHAGGPGPLRYAIARLHPEPELVDLPPPPPDLAFSPGPVPAPTGNGRYFAYGFPVVYDALGDRWIPTAVKPTDFYEETTGISNDFPFEWGATREELHATFNFYDGAHFLWAPWHMQPKIEFPPFDDELGFRVAGTASCLNLRKSADEESAVLSCLPDGTRVTLGQPRERTREGEPYPNAVGDRVYVRTEDGLEGWVSSAYLDYD